MPSVSICCGYARAVWPWRAWHVAWPSSRVFRNVPLTDERQHVPYRFFQATVLPFEPLRLLFTLSLLLPRASFPAAQHQCLSLILCEFGFLPERTKIRHAARMDERRPSFLCTASGRREQAVSVPPPPRFSVSPVTLLLLLLLALLPGGLLLFARLACTLSSRERRHRRLSRGTDARGRIPGREAVRENTAGHDQTAWTRAHAHAQKTRPGSRARPCAPRDTEGSPGGLGVWGIESGVLQPVHPAVRRAMRPSRRPCPSSRFRCPD